MEICFLCLDLLISSGVPRKGPHSPSNSNPLDPACSPGLSNVSDIGEDPCDGIHVEMGLPTILAPSPQDVLQSATQSLAFSGNLYHYPTCPVCLSLSPTLSAVFHSDHPRVLFCPVNSSQVQLILLRSNGITQNAVFP